MIDTKMKYGFDDLTIIPAVQSTIDSRKECSVYDRNGMLPLITSPMYSVVNDKNMKIFIQNRIYGIYPRGCEGENFEHSFKAYGLDEFITKFLLNKKPDNVSKVVIDMANGHMVKLTETVKRAKEKYGSDLILMVGNIANPETYTVLSEAGADYVRLGIGGGSACITSCNSSCHCPMGSLIDECNKRKDEAFIVADGGMKNFDDVIKALGLGADYVMCGSIFNKALESAARTWTTMIGFNMPNLNEPVDQYSEEVKNSFKLKTVSFMKEYYGMSTKRAQTEMGNTSLKTSEGISKYNSVEYTLGQWTENFEHYLQTAMSYTGKRTLAQFIGNVDLAVISTSAHAAYRK